MHRKRNLFWITALFLLSFPTGYLAAYSEDKMAVGGEELITLIAGGIACILLLGMISAIIYIIMRVRKSADPAKAPLIVYSVLIALLIINYSVQFPGAMKKREREAFLEDFRETLTTKFTQQIKDMPDAPAELKEHAQEVCACIFYTIKSNEKLVDQLMTVPDPKNFAANSPEIKKITGDCFALYLDE